MSKISYEGCKFANECDDQICESGHFCDVFEKGGIRNSRLERIQRPVTVIDKFHEQVRFDKR